MILFKFGILNFDTVLLRFEYGSNTVPKNASKANLFMNLNFDHLLPMVVLNFMCL